MKLFLKASYFIFLMVKFIYFLFQVEHYLIHLLLFFFQDVSQLFEFLLLFSFTF